MSYRFKIFFIMFFIVIIISPAVLTCICDNTSEINENRVKVSRPVYDSNLLKFSKKYFKYFKENYIGRDFYIKIYNYTKYNVLGESTVPDRVLIGKDNYLFYSKVKDGNSIADYQGLISVSDEQKYQLHSEISLVKEWLDKRNIKFYIIVAPDKHSVYSDKIPGAISRLGLTAADQIISFLMEKDFKVIDLRPVLKNARLTVNDELYYKTDTHWNSLGAYIGYLEILKQLSTDYKNLKPLMIDIRNVIFTDYSNGGDLYNMLGIKDYRHFRDAVIDYNKKFRIIKSSQDVIITESKAKIPRALVYRDSFCVALQPFLSNNFSYSYYQWSYENTRISRDLILKIKPDIVIVEILERYLKYLNVKLI